MLIPLGTPQGTATQQAARGERGFGTAIDYRGREVVAARAYLPSFRWGLTVKQDASEAYGLVRFQRAAILGLSLVTILGVTLAALAVARSISSPIRAAMDVARQVAGGDLRASVNVTTDDETGALLGAIRTMTNDLRGLIGRIQKSSVALISTATAIQATSSEQQQVIADYGASTSQAVAAVKQISVTSQELLRTIPAPPEAPAVVESVPAPIPAAPIPAGGSTWTIPLQLNLTVTVGTPLNGAVAAAAEERELLGLFGRRPSPPATPAAPPAPAVFRLESLERRAFDWQTALSLALASELAYSPAAEVERRARAWGFQDCAFVEAGAAQGFLASTASLVLVAFRGTESTADWLSNLKVQPRTVPGLGKVHAGFWGQFTALQPQLEKLLQPRRNLPLLVSGHSLGGAIAVLAAATWATDRQVRALCTYGQPAVALEGAAIAIGTALAGRHHRLVNDADIVPRVPPGYRHSGHLLHFDDKGQVKDVKDPAGAREMALTSPGAAAAETAMLNKDDFLALQQRLRGSGAVQAREGVTDLISDHMIDQYLGQIRKQLG